LEHLEILDENRLQNSLKSEGEGSKSPEMTY